MTIIQKLSVLLFLIIATPNNVVAQYLDDNPIDDSDVSKWHTKSIKDYLSTYILGESDFQVSIRMFGKGSELMAQMINKQWKSDKDGFVSEYTNLTNFKIDKKGKFSSDQYKGEFVLYTKGDQTIKCIKIYDIWGKKYILARKQDRTVYLHAGKYPIASTQYLNPKVLSKMTSAELQIMRNEIFARYGYKFIKGGKMDRYFRNQTWGESKLWRGETYLKNQKWYYPQHTNVDNFLTKIEKENIKIIRNEEKKR